MSNKLTVTEPSTVRSQEPGGAEWCVEIVHLNLKMIVSWLCKMKGYTCSTYSHCSHSPSEGEKVSKGNFLLLETEEEGRPNEVETQLCVVQLKSLVGLGTMIRQISQTDKTALLLRITHVPEGVTAVSKALTARCEA